MTFGIEETGRDQELIGPTGLLELLIHPGQILRHQARLLGGVVRHARTCWVLAGGEQGLEAAGLVGPEL